MKYKSKAIIATAIGLAILCIIVIVNYIFIQCKAYPQKQMPLSRLNVVGEYQLGKNSPLKSLDSFDLIANTTETLYIYGHFDQAIPENYQVILCIQNLIAKIYINDQLVFSFGDPGTYPSFSDSPGNRFISFISPGIQTTDRIEIQLTDTYPNFNVKAFSDFLERIYSGYQDSLIMRNFSDWGLSIILCIVYIALGVLVLLALIIMKALHVKGLNKYLYFVGFILSGGTCMFVKFDVVWIYWPHTVFYNLLAYWCVPIMFLTCNAYLYSFIQGFTKRILTPLLWINIAAVYFLIAFFILGYDGYSILDTYLFFSVLHVIVQAVCLYHEAFVSKNAEARKIFYSISILILAGMIEAVDFYLRFIPQGIVLLLGFIGLILFQAIQMIYCFVDNMRKATKSQELMNELLQNRMRIMLTQIQPHFVANTLTTISALCETDPMTAKSVTEHFAHYLGDNIDALSHDTPMPFLKELEHVEHYLYLEKIRFDERLNVVMDTTVTGFYLPALTLQPIVENAVKHGITKRLEGGTVTIRSKESKDNYIISVIDDGVGFNDRQKLSGDGKHIGIDNVRARLRLQCGGSLYIQSIVGLGTTAKIIIPKEYVRRRRDSNEKVSYKSARKDKK